MWKASLDEAVGGHVAVKVFNQSTRSFFNNERDIYSLPFMDHANIAAFVGHQEFHSSAGPVQYRLILEYAPYGSLQVRSVDTFPPPHPLKDLKRTSKEPRKNPESLVNERINNRLKRCLRVFDYCHHLIIVNGFVLSGLSTSEQHRLGDAVPDGSLGGSRNGSPPRRRLSRR